MGHPVHMLTLYLGPGVLPPFLVASLHLIIPIFSTIHPLGLKWKSKLWGLESAIISNCFSPPWRLEPLCSEAHKNSLSTCVSLCCLCVSKDDGLTPMPMLTEWKWLTKTLSHLITKLQISIRHEMHSIAEELNVTRFQTELRTCHVRRINSKQHLI